MLKFIRGKGHHVTVERQKLQKELFSFSRSVSHGFPHRPSALAWDPKMHLLAIGTRTGLLRVYGAPGVELYGQHSTETCVLQLFFLHNKGKLISLCDDNSLHLWELNPKESNKWVLEEVKSCSLEGRLKKISTCCLHSSGNQLFIGTEGGNIYVLDVNSFEMTDNIIYQDVVMQNVPEDYKIYPGAVEAIAEHPNNPDKILVGYNRGLMVLWDNQDINAEHTYVSNQQLESLCWHRSGNQFISAHNDGSYIIWNTSDPSKPDSAPTTPYGPFPCKYIGKILWNTAKAQDNYIIFSGGMPRATYGDKSTITIMQGQKHEVLDFTSKIVDFFTISDSHEDSEFDNPHALVVLVEEELLVLDLENENWLPFHPPYLSTLHASVITCCHHVSSLPSSTWERLQAAGQAQRLGKYSTRDWPITGGIVPNGPGSIPSSHDLLITGHEDGSVRFWDASGVALSHIYTLSTSKLLVGEEGEVATSSPEEEAEWPPFRRVGTFDPFSDDPRLAIKKLQLCIFTGTLSVAGTAGQVLVFELKDQEVEKEPKALQVNIVGDRDNFVWKGHDQLLARKEAIKFEIGYHLECLVQLTPPAAVTALALHSQWGLVAAGTAHGLAVVDYHQQKCVMSKCTLNPNDLTAAGDYTMSRRKSFKKSLRESFRRLRKGRSQRRTRDKTPTRSGEDGKNTPTSTTPKSTEVVEEVVDPKPVERQVEFRSQDDSLGSMVRCLYFAQSFIINTITTTPTLWAGTNAGAIFVYTLTVPGNEKRVKDGVTCHLGKEIQLKHRAPVIAIHIVDGAGTPLPEPLEVENNRAKPPEQSGSHRVIICSEEQFKVFTLPNLKPYGKFKLTAHEGSRVRKVGLSKFRTVRPGTEDTEGYSEHCLTCLTNQGDVSIYTIPDLRRQHVYSCCRKEDINGISSLVFTKQGQGFYLHSPCEFQRFSLSAKNITTISCALELPEGARPKPKEQEPAPPSEESAQEEPETAAGIETIVEGVEESKPDTSTLSQDDQAGMDSTIDSVRDHIANMTVTSNEESSNFIVEKKEESKEVVKEVVTKVTTVTREVVVNSTGDHVEEVQVNSTTSQETTTMNQVKSAPTAHIDEFVNIDDDDEGA